LPETSLIAPHPQRAQTRKVTYILSPGVNVASIINNQCSRWLELSLWTPELDFSHSVTAYSSSFTLLKSLTLDVWNRMHGELTKNIRLFPFCFFYSSS